MGEIVMAAKTTHVPTIWLSLQEGEYHGIRRGAEEGLRELGRRAREREVDTFVVCDTHWLNRIGFHVNGNAQHRGTYTSHELPHFMHDMDYDYAGDPELAKLIGEEARAVGEKSKVHEIATLGLDYATLVPMHLMNNSGRPISVVPIGANMCSTAEENRRVGEAVARAVARTDRRVAFIASGSLSHEFPDNAVSAQYLDTISDPINTAVDTMVLDMWRKGETTDFLSILPSFNDRFDGEGAMADTAMLFGALGWDAYRGRGEMLCDYFPSTGTGQAIVDFEVAAAA